VKPYYDEGGITIYRGDCREILPTLVADVVVTDPPWRATAHPFVHRRPGDGLGVAPALVLSSGVKYGDIGHFDAEAIRLAYAVARADVLVMCGYIELKEVLEAMGTLRAVFVWHNTRPMPIPGPVARRDVSFIVWGGKVSTVDPAAQRWQSSLFAKQSLQAGCMATERFVDNGGRASHPAQEPLSLMRDLLLPLSGTVLDPFAGTGTTLVAAKNLGRRAIGIEIEERYCEIAAKRLAQSVMQFGVAE